MKANKVLIILCVIFALCASVVAQDTPDLFPAEFEREESYRQRITVVVKDEGGEIAKGAKVRLRFANGNDFSDGFHDFAGEVDEEGKFSGEAIGQGWVKVEVEKRGYYVSRKDVGSDFSQPERIRRTGKFEPWNPTVELILKKIVNPIPMLVKSAGDVPPVLGKGLEWDMIEGDWLPPHGEGRQADVVLNFEGGYTDSRNYSGKMEISFVNGDDGLIAIQELSGEESALKFPRMAPEEGYHQKKYLSSLIKKGRSYEIIPKEDDKPKGYFIRLRSERNEEGKLTAAYYGKIVGDFSLVAPSWDTNPQFWYVSYMNMTSLDRNLEFDPSKNLVPRGFKNEIFEP